MDSVVHEIQESPAGFSVLESSHRSPQFEECYRNAVASLERLLHLPRNYRVLFMQGGATAQFSAVPLNLSDTCNSDSLYMMSGSWSSAAASEAEKFTRVHRVDCVQSIVRDDDEPSRKSLLVPSSLTLAPSGRPLSYLYYCDNETIDGIEFPKTTTSVFNSSFLSTPLPLVCDMSSNFLSRSFQVSDYGCVFASAQKNFGPSGLTVAVVRDDLLLKVRQQKTCTIPKVLDYNAFASAPCGMPNTPSTFSIAVAGKVFDWIQSQFGGLDGIEEHNRRKSQLLYDAIDDMSEHYFCPVERSCRSRMNVVFRFTDHKSKQASPSLEQDFIEEAKSRGLYQLEGHRSVGGIRASLYNAMPVEGIETLVEFMRDFQLGASA